MFTSAIEDLIEEENKIKGFTVTSIDPEALYERLAYKDWSAYYLGKAFISMYRSGVKVEIDLTKVCSLDAEGKNLLFKIIFARDVEGWSDQALYEIEQRVYEILGLDIDDNDLLIEKE